jgi:hypothetical protein
MKLKEDGRLCQFIQKVKTRWQEMQVFRKRDDWQLAKELAGELSSQKTQNKSFTKEELAKELIGLFGEGMRNLNDSDPTKKAYATLLLDDFRKIHADMSDEDYAYV